MRGGERSHIAHQNPALSARMPHSVEDPVRLLITRWRDDPSATYRTWFLWEERLKNFRSIRRGLQAVVREIEDATFGNVYRGSSLETVVKSIAEQRQLFKGADHAWLWKPKLRIPDIYETAENQRAFGAFLDSCVCCQAEEQLLAAIHRLDAKAIKGLGPAAANLLYFLHPTIAPPFNTALVSGYNALTGAKVKLGSWAHYLAMRNGILALNTRHRDLLSNDLGAIAGLLFDIGSGRVAAPPPQGAATSSAEALAAWQANLARVREESEREARARASAREGDRTHTEVQGWLRDLGRALGFDVWIAANDQSRQYGGGRLGDGCLTELPTSVAGASGSDTVRFIDVLWLERDAQGAHNGRVAGAFEVEHSTSIYSGIVRMLDLALGAPGAAVTHLYLVAPDNRQADVQAQLARPAFSRIADLHVRYLPYGALERHREAMARFGTGLRAVEAVSQLLS
jgi:type II restriction enzyme